MKIYFIRHGETVWNTLKIFQGSSNSNLTEKGIEQAKKLGERLKNTKITAFYSSPLGRAIETSKLIIGERGIEISKIDEFREIGLGKVEGLPRVEFEKKYPKEFYDFFNNPKEYNPSKYEGESYYELFNRVENGLKKIVTKHKKNDIILVVCHGVTLKGIFKIIRNMNFDEVKDVEVPENTSVSIVDYDNGKYKIEVFSDISHLKEGECV